MTLQNGEFQQQVERQLTLITEQENTMHSLQCFITQLQSENKKLLMDRKMNASTNQLHKQTHTALPGEDCTAEGLILYPNVIVLNAIRAKREKQFTQKYVDPTGEAQLLPIIKLKNNMYSALWRCLSKRHHIHRIYAQGRDQKKYWMAEPKNQCITRSMRAKCLATFYKCCKYSVLHWPDTDDKYDPEDTDDELLEQLEQKGHSDNPEDYAHIMPEPKTWEPLMEFFKKRLKQSESKTFKIQMDHSTHWFCAMATAKIAAIKAAMTDQDSLINVLKAMNLVPKDYTNVVRPDQINEILSTIRDPEELPMKATRASRHKRKWALLLDLGLAKQNPDIPRPRKAITAGKIKEHMAKLVNMSKHWVVQEGMEYLSQENNDTLPNAENLDILA